MLAAEIDRAYLEWGLGGDRGVGDRRRGGDAGDADREGAGGAGSGDLATDQARVRAERRSNEKTDRRIPFPSREPGRVEMRRCRRQGLEERRRCGLWRRRSRGPGRLVWARGRVSTEECPKSLVTPAEYRIDREDSLYGRWAGGVLDLTARELDAFLAMEKEWRAEADRMASDAMNITRSFAERGANGRVESCGGSAAHSTSDCRRGAGGHGNQRSRSRPRPVRRAQSG